MTAKKKPAKRYPPLPAVIQQPGGPVTIVLARNLTDDDGAAASGHYANRPRVISIDADEPRSFQWLVLFHELAHVAIMDAGIGHALTETSHEILADAIATARMRERFG
jgi:hypothetical protein